jgi:hypothetical protein
LGQRNKSASTEGKAAGADAMLDWAVVSFEAEERASQQK